LLKFLRSVEPQHLYLVGDIVDAWKWSRSGIYWNDTYSLIIRRILGMMKRGTRITYIAGNHDEFLRKFIPNTFGHIRILDECIHETAKGEKLLITHGDSFDALMLKMKWLYFLGDMGHTMALWVNERYNWIRKLLRLPYWSVSLYLKRNVKKAANFVNDFEHFIAKYTKEKGCSGVVCGHIHTPVIKNIEGITYCNCGDWVESCTAIIETHDGDIELIDYHKQLAEIERYHITEPYETYHSNVSP